MRVFFSPKKWKSRMTVSSRVRACDVIVWTFLSNCVVHILNFAVQIVIKAIYEKGKEKQVSELKKGNNSPFGSIEPNGKKTHNTNKEIGKAISHLSSC